MRVNALCAAVLLAMPGLAAAQIVYGGSSTFVETLVEGGVAKAFQAKTGTRVQIADVAGTGRGLEALAQGKVNVVGAGRPLTADEKKAGLIGTTVGYDGLAVFVHRSNPVKTLGKDQLKDLFTGKVKSWKELGGKDVRIVPMVEPVASKRATVLFVQERVLDATPFAPGLKELDQLKDQVVEVSRNEGAICVASLGFLASADPAVRAGIRAIQVDSVAPTPANVRSGAYLLSRPMLLVTRGLPTGDVKAFLDYVVSRDGQAIVERYLVPVKR